MAGRAAEHAGESGRVLHSLLRCRFNTSVVGATYDAPTQALLCDAPAAAQVGFVEIAISSNGGVDFAQSASAFFEYLWSDVYALRPTSGPHHGGTRLTLIGNGFVMRPPGVPATATDHVAACIFGVDALVVTRGSHDYACPVSPVCMHACTSALMGALVRCVWAQVVVAATITSTRSAECTSPPMAHTVPAKVALRVDGAMATATAVWFHYAEPPAVLSFAPAAAALAGGTMLDVHGTGFVQRDGLATIRCRLLPQRLTQHAALHAFTPPPALAAQRLTQHAALHAFTPPPALAAQRLTQHAARAARRAH